MHKKSFIEKVKEFLSEENIKEGYFQGGGHENEPTPKKKRYKDKPIDQNLTKSKGTIFKNYDLYETEGVDGPAKEGPGTGFYQNMDKYDSVSDFLNKKRKKRKLALRQIFLKKAIDFALDDQVTPIIGDNSFISGLYDYPFDFDKDIPAKANDKPDKINSDIDEFIETILTPTPSSPDLKGNYDEEAEDTGTKPNYEYGPTNSGRNVFDEKYY